MPRVPGHKFFLTPDTVCGAVAMTSSARKPSASQAGEALASNITGRLSSTVKMIVHFQSPRAFYVLALEGRHVEVQSALVSHFSGQRPTRSGPMHRNGRAGNRPFSRKFRCCGQKVVRYGHRPGRGKKRG
jgi:hypothetical protein